MVRSSHDEAASSSVIAFLVAGSLFMASVIAVLVVTRDSAGSATAESNDVARANLQASALANILLSSPGYFHETGSSTPSPLDWSNAANYQGQTDDAERLDRLGLLDADDPTPFMMDFAKFQNLRRAGYLANATNGYVDYQEAVRTLGLSNAGFDFHLRAYPTLDSLQKMLQTSDKDQNLRVAYVGDIEVTTTSTSSIPPTQGLTVGTPTCSKDPATTTPYSYPKSYRISVPITNGGTVTTQFTAFTTANLGGTAQTQNSNGFLVPPGSTMTLAFDVAATSGRSCAAGKSVSIDLYDPVHDKLLTATHTFTSSDAVTGATAAESGLVVDTSKQNYRPAEPVVLSYDGLGMKNKDKLFLRVCKGTAECTNTDAVFKHPSGGGTFEAANKASDRIVTVGALGILPAQAGVSDGSTYTQYTAWLYDCEDTSCSNPHPTGSANLRASEAILVTSSSVAGYTPQGTTVTATSYTAPAGPAQEVRFLEMLIEQFCPSFFDTKTSSPLGGWSGTEWDSRCAFKGSDFHPGDVYPDSKKVMNQDLPARLLHADGTPNYDDTDVLVVGSGVDHNAMTSQSAKGTIEAWVHGGGTLLVFGSDEGNVNWLQPLFHSAIRGGGGAISTPDQGHPLLHSPNELDNPAINYDARDTAWRFNGQTAKAQDDPTTAVFDNVIVVDGNELTGDPLLALSTKGSFGAGSILITAYMPYDLYNDGGTASAQPAGTECPGLTVGECEGLKFLHNMLMQGYADLFLDYGPPIPANTDVEPSVRTARIRHPEFVAPIDLTMIVYVW